MSGRIVAAAALAGALVGAGIALAVTAATDEVWRATALVRADGPARVDPDDARAEITAATLAEVADSRGFLAEHAGSLGGGRLSPGELAGRLDARHPQGTELVEIVARDDSRAGARALADGLAAALVADAEERSRLRAARIEEELRPRIERLSTVVAEIESTTGSLRSAATTDRLRSLRTERAALQARLADAAARAAEQRLGVAVVARASTGSDPIRPRPELNLFGGVLLGLVAGLGTTLLRRRPPAAQAAVRIVRPAAGAALSGRVVLEADAPGATSVEMLVSDGSAEWRTIGSAAGDSARVEWDASALEPGAYWLCAVARDGNGRADTTEPQPVRVEP